MYFFTNVHVMLLIKQFNDVEPPPPKKVECLKCRGYLQTHQVSPDIVRSFLNDQNFNTYRPFKTLCELFLKKSSNFN